MSTQLAPHSHGLDGFPDLTTLGKRLEILRIERGVSKQHLARHAGTSRQQLWRVMTGKSELTHSLRDRLATALAVEPGELFALGATASVGSATLASLALREPVAPTATSVEEYLSDPSHVAGTLATMPAGDGGRRLKRALLDSLEDLAVDSARPLPVEYSEMRRRVMAGEL